MNKQHLLLATLLVVVILTATGCGGGQATADGGDEVNELKARCHTDLGLQDPSTYVKAGFGTLGTICFLIALSKLFKKQSHMSALGWAGIMMAILLWLSFGQAIMDGIEGGWPGPFDQALVDDALGRVGTVHEGDYTPGTGTLVDIVITLVCAGLRLTHGLLGMWFVAILPISLVLSVWLAGLRGGLAVIGTFLGGLVWRRITPDQLYEWTLRIQAERARVEGGLPGISQVQAAYRNTTQQLNLEFIAGWVLIPLGIFIVCAVSFVAIATLAGPTIGGWIVGAGRAGLGVYDDVRRRKRQIDADTEREERRPERAERRAQSGRQRTLSPEEDKRRQQQAASATISSESPTMSPEEAERQRKAAEAAGVHPADVEESPSGVVYPRGAAPAQSSTAPAPTASASTRSHNPSGQGGQGAVSQRPAEAARETKAKLEKDGAAQRLAKKKAQKKGEDLAAGAKVGGTVATATGNPEVGVPLTAAGGKIEDTTDRVVKSSPDQDPAMAKNQQAADHAVADFGGEEVNA